MKHSLITLAVVASLGVSACGGGSGGSDDGAPQLQAVDSLPGISLFPAYNALVENDSVLFSGSVDNDEVLAVYVNDQAVADPANWQRDVELSIGDNDVTVRVETATQVMTQTRTIRYHGVIQQGSEGLQFDGGHRVTVNDYRADRVVVFDLDRQFAKGLSGHSVEGLPDQVNDAVLFGDIAYVTGYGETSQGLYRVDLLQDTATLLAEGSFDNLLLNEAGTRLYYYSGSTFSYLDTSSLESTLVLDPASFDDDFEIFSIWEYALDEANDRLILLDQNYRTDVDTLVTVSLSGGNAGRLEALSLSAEQGCVGLPERLNGYFGPRSRDGNLYLANSSGVDTAYALDLSNYCLAPVFVADEMDLPVDSSLQGVDFNPVTQDLYLGFYSGPMSYNLLSGELGEIERQGFSNAPQLFEEPYQVGITPDGVIYTASEEFLTRFDPSTGEARHIQEFGAEITGVVMDAEADLVYVTTEDGELGQFSLQDDLYQQLAAPDALGVEFEHIVRHSDGRFLFLDSDTIYAMTLESLVPEVISADGIPVRRESGMVLDEAGNRLLLDVELNNESVFLAVDLTTGARTHLNEGAPVGYDIYDGIGLYQGDLIFPTRDGLKRYSLSDFTLTALADQRRGDSAFGELTTFLPLADGTLVMGDDDKNGFWQLNLETGERVFLQ